jgi:hypothetical protein
MFERLFMPALTFCVLGASIGAFAADLTRSAPGPEVQQLERVVVASPRAAQ